ncbi:MAG: NAD-dependent epimerase/dehydratase family protein [Gammaproteobacteria bacterium]|jgi:nucleoside-diphosphate-sugar epimerase|nr:NAD-dependent epimerase/dehydratase family protein [Gammaproteobacteria bacterium]
MHILITGANGFIGRHLIKKLIDEADSRGISRITALDLSLELVEDHPLIKKISGSFADPEILTSALEKYPADCVFHLASVPSGLAQSNYSLGVNVNIQGTMALLEKLKDQGNLPTLIFASSIAVYGKPATAEVNDDTLPTPNLTYGSQKVIGETLVADFVRRGWIKGCSLRLPGIVARPPEPNGAVSIFFSDLIRCLSSGQTFTCPVSPDAKSWLMSVNCVVENLINAETISNADSNGKCHTWTLPAMHVSIEALVNQIDDQFPEHNVQSLITYQADPWIEENFGSYPPIHCPKAEAAGFRKDENIMSLIKKALKGF